MIRSLLTKLLSHAKSAVTGPSGRISSSRCMMIVTGVFAMVVIAVIVEHMLQLHSPQELAAWCAALQTVGGILVALAGLPYTCGKLSGSLGEIVAAIKKRGD
jgi:hypothetical protein